MYNSKPNLLLLLTEIREGREAKVATTPTPLRPTTRTRGFTHGGWRRRRVFANSQPGVADDHNGICTSPGGEGEWNRKRAPRVCGWDE